MAWLDQLRHASFKGVPFKVDTVDWTLGDNVVMREYPFQDKPTVFRMGAATQVLKFSAYVIGDDYLDQLDRLIDALTGDGDLVHPTAGTMRAFMAGPYTLSESPTESGGMARLDLSFVKAEPRRYPTAVANTGAAADAAAAQAKAAAVDAFVVSFNLANSPGWVVYQVLARISSASEAIVGHVLPAVRSMQDFTSTALAKYQVFKSSLTALVNLPEQLGNTVADLFSLPEDMTADTARSVSNAMEGVFDRLSKPTETVALPTSDVVNMLGIGSTATTSAPDDAGSIYQGGFVAQRGWDFNGALEGWTGYDGGAAYGSLAAGASYAMATANLIVGYGYFSIIEITAALAQFSGASVSSLRMRLQKPTGGQAWQGIFYWSTSTRSGWANPFWIIAPEPTWDANGWGVAEWLVSAMSAPQMADFYSGSISGLRIDLVRDGTPSQTQIDQIAVGTISPGTTASLIIDTDAQRQLSQANAAIDQLVSTMAIASIVQAQSVLADEAPDEVDVQATQRLRTLLYTHITGLLSQASTSASVGSSQSSWHDAMMRLLSASLAELRSRPGAGNRLDTYTPNGWEPVWLISYKLYGSAAYADEILAMNPQIIHPLLVPPGKPITVVRHG